MSDELGGKMDIETEIEAEILGQNDVTKDKPDFVTPADIAILNQDRNILKNEVVDVKCETCGEQFVNNVAFIIHEMLHREDKYCFVCKRNISNDFRKHVQDRHMNHVCEICNNVFTFKRTLESHIRSHKKERRFNCNECDKSFMQRCAMTVHINAIHKGLRPFVCEECEGTFTTPSSLKRHKNRMHSVEAIFECDVCKIKFCDKKKRDDHKNSHGKLKVCNVCKQTFTKKESFVRHVNEHLKTVTCIHCKRKFAKSEIDAHMVKRHQPRTCPTCRLTFYDSCALSSHQKCHEARVTCELCNRTYSESNMKRHLQLHDANKVQRCEICNFMCTDIDKHNVRMHKGTKFCFCPLCPKKFLKRSRKNRHIAIAHCVGGRFKCKFCGKGFTVRAALSKHLNVHYTFRPYKCLICKRRFINLPRLEKHIEMHDKLEYKFSCTSCGRAFKIQKSLDKHRCGGVFACYLCKVKYKFKNYLNRHMIMFHSPVIFTDKNDLDKGNIGRIHFFKDGSKKFQCKKCQVVFKHPYSFKMHYCNTKNKIGYNCSVCRKKYFMRKHLVQHFEEEHPNDILNCEICGQLFLNRRYLRRHCLKVHKLNENADKEDCTGSMKNEKLVIVDEVIKTEKMDSDVCIKEEPLIKDET